MIAVLGAKEVQRVFEQLEPKLQRQAMRTVFRRLGNIARGEVISTAPVGASGALRRSVKVRSIKRNRNRVGVNVLSSFAGWNQYYGTMLEFGTRERRTRSGKNTGRIAARRWMGRAFDRRANQMLTEGQDLLRSEILRLAEEGASGR